MTELDFDELDRAVNSLMGGVKDAPEGRKAQQKTLQINSTLADGEKPMHERIEAAAKRIGNEAIEDPREHTAVLPDSQRSQGRGRFMDVFHPSSDMKQSKGVAKAETTLDETGAKILTLPTRQEDTPKEAVAPSPKDAPAEKTAEKVIVTPIEAAVLEEVPVVTPTPNVEMSAEPTAVNTPVEVASPATPSPVAPLASPFIPDAQVEKRPLGGAADDKKADSVESVSVADDGPVPEEFHDELLAVETSVAVESSDDDSKEKQGAIFDVNEYHTPIGQPHEKASMFVWIAVALIIVILGAGVGVAVFLLIG